MSLRTVGSPAARSAARSWSKRVGAPRKLAAGEKVFVEGFVSEKSKTFAGTVHFGIEDGKPGKKIIPEFG